MAVNIVDLVKSQFSSDFISKAADAMGETESGIVKSFNAGIPAALAALLQKSKTKGEADEILIMSKQALANPVIENLSSLFTGGASQSGLMGMSPNIFGNKITDIITQVASFAGIKTSSASSILNIITPATLAAIAKCGDQNNFTGAGLIEFLTGQKGHMLQAIPAGFNVGAIPDLANLEKDEIEGNFFYEGEGLKDTIVAANESFEADNNHRKKGGWLVPLLIAIIAIGIIWYLMKGCGNQVSVVEKTIINDTIVSVENENQILNTSKVLQLPNEIKLVVKKDGMEDRLVTFLTTDFKNLKEDSLKNIWFTFDSISFKVNEADITPESQVQISKIAIILNAFPEVKIKVGGYSDKSGSESHNKDLSAQRAKSVATALDSAGLVTQIIDTEGYGSKFAKFPESAPDSDRIKDRYIAISLRK